MTQEQNAIIGFPKQGRYFSVTGSADFDPEYPAENVLNPEYARVARCNATEAWLRYSSEYLRPIRMFGIAHRCTLGAYANIRMYDSSISPSILVKDTGPFLLWPAVYTYEGRQWDTFNFWTGQYSDEEREGQIPFTPVLLDDHYLSNDIIMEVFDPDHPDERIDLSFTEVTSGWQLTVNPETPADYGYKSYTITSTNDGGLRRHQVYAPSYVFQGKIPFMGRQEVQNNAAELIRQYGEHTPFMWMPDPDKPEEWLRNSKMVNLVELALLSYIVEGYDAVPLNLEEWKG